MFSCAARSTFFLGAIFAVVVREVSCRNAAVMASFKFVCGRTLRSEVRRPRRAKLVTEDSQFSRHLVLLLPSSNFLTTAPHLLTLVQYGPERADTAESICLQNTTGTLLLDDPFSLPSRWATQWWASLGWVTWARCTPAESATQDGGRSASTTNGGSWSQHGTCNLSSLLPLLCNDDLSAFGSSMVALAPAVTVMAPLTRRLSLM